jgi:tetratricopeptide (TPR) repeat protein
MTPIAEFFETVKSFDQARAAGDVAVAQRLGAVLLAGWPENGALMYHVGASLARYGLGDTAYGALRAAAAVPNPQPHWLLQFGVCERARGMHAEALDLFDRALAADPTLAPAWVERALIALAREELSAAADAYDRAMALGMRSLAVLVNRSVIAFRLADGERALQLAHEAVALDPTSLPAQLNAATIEGPLLGYLRALGRLDAIAGIGANDAAYARARSHTLFKLERYEAALADARRAVELDPKNPVAYELLVRGLIGLGRHDEAFAAIEAAKDVPDGGLLRVNHATLDLEVGNRDRARETLRAVVAEHPAIAVAWYTLGELDAFTGPDDIATMETLLAEAPAVRNAGDRLLVHHALGKAYLMHGDAARAFEHYATANRLKRAMAGYDISRELASISQLAVEFSADVLAGANPAANPSERPVFVVGLPRSGTSLVEQILASHPQVHGAGETSALPLVFGERASLPRSAWPELAQRYLDAVGAQAGDAARIVDKLPGNFAQAGFIRLLFPNARIIHLRRDPLDNGVSLFITLFDHGHGYSNDLRDIGRFYNAYAELMTHWRGNFPADRFLEIDYETIVDDFEVQARRLIAFIGLPWDDAVLRFYETRRTVRTASKVQVRKPIYRTSVNRAEAFGAALDPLREVLRGDAGGTG